MNYKIADVNSQEMAAISAAEDLIRTKTGKDFVLIAWEKVQKH